MLPLALVLGTVAVGIVPAAAALAAARWPQRSPWTGILLWQALGLSWGLAAVGALAALGAVRARFGIAGGAVSSASSAVSHAGRGLSPSTLSAAARLLFVGAGAGLLLLLCWVLLSATAEVLNARRRQRVLLRLLAHGDPKVPGALVVDHPAAAAYCLPGLRSWIVISAGALDVLDQDELAAVLAHERAHLRARHDLVLLPFSALAHAFPWSVLVRRAQRTVGLLVEMLADDRALRQRRAGELATALLRVSTSSAAQGTPSGALSAAATSDGEVAARVARLLSPVPPLPLPAKALICASAAAIVAIPAALLLLTF